MKHSTPLSKPIPGHLSAAASSRPRPNFRWPRLRVALLAPLAIAVSGCGAGLVTANPVNATFSLSPGVAAIDTNCTGCNGTGAGGRSVEQFAATLASSGPAAVNWSVTGGDATAGPGVIDDRGRYTPPSYLTADSAQVVVTATLVANPAVSATAVLTVTPGFLEPLTPENAAVGANGTVTVSGTLAEAGGSTGIQFTVAGAASGAGSGLGIVSPPSCQRSAQSFTTCSVTYAAPAAVPQAGASYVVATVGSPGSAPASKASAEVLLNPAGVWSNPASHQAQRTMPIDLGASGGNNRDFDTQGNQIVDCCSGTLGALLAGSNGSQYLLSNNHVLARSDQAAVGDAIVQPGLIDNNCTPSGDGPGTTPVASLTAWLPLSAAATNADAAVAQVVAGTVSPAGNILELGARQADGTLAAAPPGVSSTGGRGEPGSLDLRVAKSGRTTGLTCAGISAVNLDVSVDYFTDCAETQPYLTRLFTNQVGISGNEFSDAGDSGSLVVDTLNAEPVGLFFAGGTDAAGVSQGVASPAPEVLNELSAQPGGVTYTFVGGPDHAVSCLNYGDSTFTAAQARALPDSEITRAQQAMSQARALVNPSAGVLGVATGKSSDHPGEAAILVYVDENANAPVPAQVSGVRTAVIPTNARAVALGSAPLSNPGNGSGALTAAELAPALAVKQQVGRALMRLNPAFFGVGVGKSLDNPREAALVIYVDRKHVPAQLPALIFGVRTRYVVMDRLHVTRSYGVTAERHPHCIPRPAPDFDPRTFGRDRNLGLD